jgi:TM2 domain-containing membrane protein YozV
MYSIVGADEREYGPVELETLVQWAREGRVISRTSILDHTSGRRFLACDMEPLADVFTQTPTVAPPVLQRPQHAAPRHLGVTHPAHAPVPYGITRPRRSRTLAGLLGIVLGVFGIHRYYLGYSGIGTLMLCITLFTCGIGAALTAIWGLIEGILCLVGAMTDADGQRLGA